MNETSAPRGVAFIDEAGEKGYSRNLSTERDAQIGLMSALVFPAASVGTVREAFRPAYDSFQVAAPSREKIHITDAFRPGNEAWAEVASGVRTDILRVIASLEPVIIYDARRLGVQRETHEQAEALAEEARRARRSPIKIPNRPSDRRIETSLLEGLLIKLDVVAEALGWEVIDLEFDEIDPSVVKKYREVIASLAELESSEHTVKGWDPRTNQKVEGKISIDVHGVHGLDVTRIGAINVAGKADPVVLAADIIANGLHHHLRGLGQDAPLNAPSSIAGWELEGFVYGVRDGAIEDII